MQYNFTSAAEELLQSFEKKLETNKKTVIKNMQMLFDFMGDALPFEQGKELEQNISDILSDGNKSQMALFTQTMHKVVRSIREVVKE